MKRSSPLTRKTPMSRGSSPMKRSKMKRRKPRGQPPERRDDAFLAFVRTLPCCADVLDLEGCTVVYCGARPCDPHHKHEDGKGIKSHDRTCVPLCRAHHDDAEAKRGPFKHFTKDSTRAWHDAESKRVNELYERSRA